jgi:hypothetical protein
MLIVFNVASILTNSLNSICVGDTLKVTITWEIVKKIEANNLAVSFELFNCYIKESANYNVPS